MTPANWYWAIWFFGGFGLVEAWALLTGRNDWTLSCTLRKACTSWEWFASVFVGVLAWFAVHIVISKKDKKE